MTVGATYDTLKITYAFASTTAVGKIVIFNLTDFRNPPSTEPLSILSFSTLDPSGNIVDSSQDIGIY